MNKRQFDKIHRNDDCWLCGLVGFHHKSEETAHLIEGSRRREGFYARLCAQVHRHNKYMAMHGSYGSWTRRILIREFLRRYPDKANDLKKVWIEMWMELGGASLGRGQ